MEEFLIIWASIGTVLYGIIALVLFPERGLSIVNPAVIYDAIQVNYFGAFFVAFVHMICVGPLLTAIYWFYKLCIIGRE